MQTFKPETLREEWNEYAMSVSIEDGILSIEETADFWLSKFKALHEEIQKGKEPLYRNATNPKDKEIFDRSYGYNAGLDFISKLLQ